MKDCFTTGEVARLCGVAARTVSKWFDSGQLRGFKIPGSRERRIPRESLVRFMRAHGIPLHWLDGTVTRVLIADAEYEFADALRTALEHGFDYEVRVATGVFEAGLAARQFRPHVILLDVDLPGLNLAAMHDALRADPDLVATQVVATASGPLNGAPQTHPPGMFCACLAKPYGLRDAVRAIEEATDLVS
jgi:excisionase family DNA binding protein